MTKKQDPPELQISVVIADDQAMLADALAAVVESKGGLRMAAPPVYSPEAVIELCERLTPDVALLDLVYDGVIAGIYATARIRSVSPKTQVVVMTSHEDPHLLLEAVEAGAAGFLKKTEAVDLVIETIRGVAAGKVMIEAGVLARVMRESAAESSGSRRIADLTPRETEILDFLRSGSSNRDIAEQLVITRATVETHVHHLLEKLGARSRLEAVVIAGQIPDWETPG